MGDEKLNVYLLEGYPTYFDYLSKVLGDSTLAVLRGAAQNLPDAIALIQAIPQHEQALFLLDLNDGEGGQLLLRLIRELGKEAGWIVLSTAFSTVYGADYGFGKNISAETIDNVIRITRSQS